MRGRSAWALVLLATACREAPDRYIAPDPFDSATVSGQLTWNVYEDHSPAWNESSDSVYYSARSFPGFPATGGLLLKVPRTAGRAQLLLESLQRATSPQPYFTAPALSPDRESIAFVEMVEMNDPTELCTDRIDCHIPTIGGPDTSAANALLMRGLLRVRPLNGGAEASIPIAFEGVSGNARIAHPFQRQYERDRAEVFRPSWSPDGTRLVYSDGLRLRIFNIASGTSTVIPGTDDGVWPAWSPTGDVIAFTRLLRNGSHSIGCDCYREGRSAPVAVIGRTIYHDGNTRTGTLMTIRPDGTDARTLGVGEAPAWTPDGNALVFQRGDQLYRANADGAAATPIPGTAFGYEPAISPDGRFLAFTRDTSERDRLNSIIPNDIWVINF